jgi:hypothetical protein
LIGGVITTLVLFDVVHSMIHLYVNLSYTTSNLYVFNDLFMFQITG